MTGMLETVQRQQELRIRLLNAAYTAFIQEADGFIDALSLNPSVSVPINGEDGEPLERVDFGKTPPSPAELRAAAYYLVERGLLVMMSKEALEKHQLKPTDVYIHITAGGVDGFEALVLANESRNAARPVGFQFGPSEPREAKPVRFLNPWSKAQPDPSELEADQS